MSKLSPEIVAILQRIVKESGTPEIIDVLSQMPAPDLQSLLIYVYQHRVERRTAKQLFDVYRNNRYLGVSEISQREIVRLNSLFYSVVPKEIEAVELSPVCPLGVNGILTNLSQNNTLPTIRGLEVVSDPTVALALECALRRRRLLDQDPKDARDVNLCTSQRLLRLQPFDKAFGFMQHFVCYAVCTAGRDTGHERFLIDSFAKHLGIYLDLLQVFCADAFAAENLTVFCSDVRIIEHVIAAMCLDRTKVTRNTQNRDYRPFLTHAVHLPEVVEDIGSLAAEDVERYRIGPSIELLAKIQQTVVEPMRVKYPHVRFAFNLARVAGIGYYPDFCFHVYGTNARGIELQLADGGLADWTAQLLNSRKERLFTSGFGADLFHKMFQR